MSIMIDCKFIAEDYSIFVALLENSHEFKIWVKMTEGKRQYSFANRAFLNSPFFLLLWDWSPFISQFDINLFLISNICRVLNVVCLLLGNFPASEFRSRGITQRKAYNIDINVLIIEFTNSSSYFALSSDTFVAKECYAETQALCVLSKGRKFLYLYLESLISRLLILTCRKSQH
jgi:hypothetical protein